MTFAMFFAMVVILGLCGLAYFLMMTQETDE